MARRQDEWLMHFTPADIAELETAGASWSANQRDLAATTVLDFPLSTLAAKLQQLRAELIHGRGFALLRGFPSERLGERTAGAVFYALGLNLGNPRSQNARGDRLGHVRDIGLRSGDPNVRIYQTSERQSFHTDSADAVGLLCLKTARTGGTSLLVSSQTIFNEMRRLRPDLLRLLLEPIATDRRGEVPAGRKPYFLIPVFSYYQEHLTTVYQRQYIDSAQRFADAPRLTPGHVEALNLFDELANDSRLNFSMRLEPGDVQFVYNHALLHDRTAFEDWPEASQKRHLLRLWLALPGDHPLPEIFASRFGSIEVGNRGGVGMS